MNSQFAPSIEVEWPIPIDPSPAVPSLLEASRMLEDPKPPALRTLKLKVAAIWSVQSANGRIAMSFTTQNGPYLNADLTVEQAADLSDKLQKAVSEIRSDR